MNLHSHQQCLQLEKPLLRAKDKEKMENHGINCIPFGKVFATDIKC